MKKIVFVLLLAGANLFAQDEIPSKSSEDPLAGLKFRNIGPAFTSGRIADIAIHPEMTISGTWPWDPVGYGKP